MSFTPFLFLLIVVGAMLWGSRWLRHWGRSSEEVAQQNLGKWGSRALIVLVALIVVDSVNRYGFVDLDEVNPLSGPIAEDLPQQALPARSVPNPPVLEVESGRPDLDAVIDEHQEQLDDFEESTTDNDDQ